MDGTDGYHVFLDGPHAAPRTAPAAEALACELARAELAWIASHSRHWGLRRSLAPGEARAFDSCEPGALEWGAGAGRSS